jgi:hypothetical protein
MSKKQRQQTQAQTEPITSEPIAGTQAVELIGPRAEPEQEPNTSATITQQEPTEAAATAAPPQSGPKGVKLSRSRSFLAGALLRETGLEVGVTDEMVARIDGLYQGGTKANATQTKFDLAGAWHTLKGYLEGKLEA